MKLSAKDTQTLLAAFVKDRSDSAFCELVARYIDLVYSTALRLVHGDRHLAEDVAQTVFVDLARKAPRLPPDVMLGGWLHQHTRFVASTAVRSERRRQRRERQAVEMNSLQDQPGNLEQIGPLLDEAISLLAADDRAAILLRFFQHRDFASIAGVLGGTEDAARMRVNRALAKLNSILQHRGVTLSTAGLATVLATDAVTAAPAGLAGSIAAAALATTAAGSSTTLTLIKWITMSKVKAGLIGALALAGAGTPIFLQQQANARLRSQVAALQQQAAEADQLREENQRLAKLRTGADELARLRTEHEELLRLRGQMAATRRNQPTTASSSGKSNGGSKSQSSPESPSIPLIPAADWKDVGTANPSDTLQTLFWAISNQNTNAFLKTLIWDPAGKAKLDSLFAAAPESVRQKFGSADGLIWEMVKGGHDTPMTGFGVVSVATQGDDATLIEEHQYQDGSVRQNPIKLHREDDGWRVLLDEQRLEKLIGYLTSLNSQNGGK